MPGSTLRESRGSGAGRRGAPPNSESRRMERPGWRFGSPATPPRHKRPQPCKRCAASVRRKTFGGSYLMLTWSDSRYCFLALRAAHRQEIMSQELSPGSVFFEAGNRVAFRLDVHAGRGDSSAMHSLRSTPFVITALPLIASPLRAQ